MRVLGCVLLVAAGCSGSKGSTKAAPTTAGATASDTATDTDTDPSAATDSSTATDTTTATTTDTATDTAGGDGDDPLATPGVVLVADDLGDLGLSSAFAVTPPPAIVGGGEEVELTESGEVQLELPLTQAARKKSQAACEMRRRVKATLRSLRTIARQLCYVETDLGALPFGKAYKVAGNDGAPAVKVDKSSDAIKVSVCYDGVPTYEFSVDGAKDQLARGSFRSATSEGRFDNGFTASGRTDVTLRSVDNGYRERTELTLLPDGVSALRFVEEVTYLHEDTGEPTSLTTTISALIGQSLGQSIRYLTGDQDGDGAPDPGSGERAAFDAAGYPIPLTASPFLAAGGALRVDETALPRGLPADYVVPAPGAAGDWDCSGVEEVDAVGTNEAYLACDALLNGYEDEDCTLGETYEGHGEAVTGAEFEGD